MARPEKIGKLIELLVNSSWNQRQMARRKVVERLLWSGFVATCALIFLAQAPSQWHGGGWWDDVSGVCGGMAFLLGFFLGFVALRHEWRERQRLLTASLALRAAAEDGDEQLAPLAVEQPQPLAPDALAAGPERFALFGSWKASGLAIAGAGALLLLIGGGLSAAFVFFIVSIQPSTGLAIAVLVFLALVAFLTLVMGLVFLAVSWGPPLRSTLVTDEYGVRWWRSGWHHLRPAFIPWNAVTSFFVIAYTGEKEANSGSFYVLDAHHSLLLWRVSAAVPKGRLAMFAHFNAVVTARTRLPLRDLSAAAAQVTHIAEGPDAIG